MSVGRPRNPLPRGKRGALARKVRELREAAGLSVEEAAKCVGVSPITWWRYERGERSPSLSRLLPILALPKSNGSKD